MRSLALVLLPLLAGGCLRVQWERELVFTPLEQGRLAQLDPGESTLEEVLALLGAPLHVWEGSDGGVVLAWGAREQQTFGLNASIPLGSDASASFDWEGVDADLEGQVLFFDAELRLVLVRAGRLRELAPQTRRRPAPAPEGAAAGAQPGARAEAEAGGQAPVASGAVGR